MTLPRDDAVASTHSRLGELPHARQELVHAESGPGRYHELTVRATRSGSKVGLCTYIQGRRAVHGVADSLFLRPLQPKHEVCRSDPGLRPGDTLLLDLVFGLA